MKGSLTNNSVKPELMLGGPPKTEIPLGGLRDLVPMAEWPDCHEANVQLV